MACCSSFTVFGQFASTRSGITAYLEAGGTLENAQAMAAHESPRGEKPRLGNTQFPCLITVCFGYSPHARCQNFSCAERGCATHYVWYSLEGGPYSGTRSRGYIYRFPRFRHRESA